MATNLPAIKLIIRELYGPGYWDILWKAILKFMAKEVLNFIKNIYKDFEKVMVEHGIGTISEVYDGDPPHKAGGAISQAWSVAELLRINWLIKKYEQS